MDKFFWIVSREDSAAEYRDEAFYRSEEKAWHYAYEAMKVHTEDCNATGIILRMPDKELWDNSSSLEKEVLMNKWNNQRYCGLMISLDEAKFSD